MLKSRFFTKLANRFKSDSSGNVAVVFALSLVPLVLLTGGVVDFSNMTAARADLQNALDSAALSAALAPANSESGRRRAADMAMQENLSRTILTPDSVAYDINFDAESVSMTGSYNLPTTFLRLVGLPALQVGAKTTVNAPQAKQSEIVLVLDYSGSMTERSNGETKYVTMRNAAINLVNDLSFEEDPERVKFGLVAYSSVIKITVPTNWVRGEDPEDTSLWTGCVQDREYPFNINGTVPDPGREETKWIPYDDGRNNTENGACGAFDLQSVPLTSSTNRIVNQLEDMRPIPGSGRLRKTHISLGMEAGLNLLAGGSVTGASSIGEGETKKFLILLTDGRQTTRANGPRGRTVRRGERNLEALCETAQGLDNVTVLTVAFDLRDNSTENRLADCASDRDSGAFVAEDGNALQGVFNEIKNQIRQSVFISS